VIADEIYEAVAWDKRSHLPIYSLPGMCERTIGLVGMTKTYSMGGWRIGESADRYVRITCVRSWDELRAGLDRIEQFVESLR